MTKSTGSWTMVRLALVALAGAVALMPTFTGTAQARGCHWEGFKIVNREGVSCATAKSVLSAYFGGGGSQQGFDCSGYFSGHCSKNSRSFHFRER
jgi:hypothetical protein